MGGHSDERLYRDEEWLREQYHRRGKSTYEIAESAGIHPSTVQKWMAKRGIDRRSVRDAMVEKKTPNENLRDEKFLRRKYLTEGRSTVDIAKELDCSSSAVNRWLEHHSIPIRGRETAKVESLIASQKLRNPEFLRREYVEEERTIDEIGDELGCHGDTVRRWLTRHDIPSRSRGPIQIRNSTRDVRSTRRYQNIRRNILIRDGFTCQDCGVNDDDKRLTVHHIVPVCIDESRAMDPANLVSLCRRCHAVRHRESEYDVVDWKVILNAVPPRADGRSE